MNLKNRNRTRDAATAHGVFLLLWLAWPAMGQNAPNAGTNITVQLPTFGIAVDAAGVLQAKAFEDPTGELRVQRRQAARTGLPADIAALSKLRKVSLPRLERAIRVRLDDGKPLDDSMRYLAGLQRLQFVFCYPESGDIVIAGAAEGWMQDLSGRTVGLTTGRPVLELFDLLVALRAYPAGKRERPFVGCTIDPPQAGLVRLQEFQRQIPRVVPQDRRGQVATEIAKGIRESLGMAQILVLGVPADTHFAHVLIEADYRMKLIGIELEQPPIKLASFLDLTTSARHGTLQRWWFTPKYDCVKMTADRLGMELIGQGVQLWSDYKLIDADGLLRSVGFPNKGSDLFTEGFTSKYSELAARSPVFVQLRNAIDMLVAAVFIEHHDYYQRTHWTPTTLADEKQLPVRTLPAPTQVEAAVNVVWKGNRLLSPAGGGVSIRAHQALEPNRLIADERGQLKAEREKVGQALPDDRWWWD